MNRSIVTIRSIGLWKASSRDFESLLDESEDFDTEILVGEEPNTKTFKAHSLILKTRSPYYRTALSNNWVKTKDNVITLRQPNISIENFDILLKFIYTGVILLTIHDTRTIIKLLIAADELLLNKLCEHIEECLVDDECSLKKNFVLIQKIASQLTQFTKILKFYEENVRIEPSLILKAEDFETIQQDMFLTFLTEYGQSLEPMQLWDKLIKWAIAQPNELPPNTENWTSNEITTFGTVVQPFLTHINFKEINISDFCQNIKPFKNIFDNEFYVELLEHYSFNEDVHSKFKLDIDSKIITSGHAFLLKNLIGMVTQDSMITFCNFELLIRGSRDGFDTKSFHRCCDEQGPTITVASIKDTNEIVGGFSPLDWNPRCDHNITNESFIFSLDKKNLNNFIFSKVVEENRAIYKRRGPDFGDKKSDLRLLDGDKNVGQCYKNSYERLIRDSEGVFHIDDYEVFQLHDHTWESVEPVYRDW